MPSLVEEEVVTCSFILVSVQYNQLVSPNPVYPHMLLFSSSYIKKDKRSVTVCATIVQRFFMFKKLTKKVFIKLIWYVFIINIHIIKFRSLGRLRNVLKLYGKFPRLYMVFHCSGFEEQVRQNLQLVYYCIF